MSSVVSSNFNASGFDSVQGIYRSRIAPASIPSDPYLHFVAYLFSGNAGNPHFSSKLAMIDCKSGQSVTYGEFRRYVRAVAAGLAGLGLTKGSVVLILLNNSVFTPVAFNAVLAIGAVVTTINPLSTVQEIGNQLRDSKAVLIITSDNLVEKVKNTGLPLVLLGDERRAEVLSECTPFSRLLLSDPLSAPEVQICQSDTAALLYSSGTTGVSKGVILSHGNFIAALSMLEKARGGPLPDDDVRMALLPMFHVAGLVWIAGDILHSGGTLIILPKFEMADFLEAIHRYRITYLPIVPPVVVALTKSPLVGRYDLSSVRIVQSGGSPLAKNTIQAFLERHPHVASFEQAYGMTETTGISVGFAANEPFGSAGKLMPNVEARVVDIISGKPLPPNKQGELLLRGPFLMQGYLNNVNATTETIDQEGWLHTGDLVYFDDNGSMFVVDRLKELIKHKSFQVAPAELEALLLTHLQIEDCAVLPFQDEYAGEIPLAYVVRSSGSSLRDSEVMDFVAGQVWKISLKRDSLIFSSSTCQVAPHKKVRKVIFVDSIPKSPSGKILRKLLKGNAQAKL